MDLLLALLNPNELALTPHFQANIDDDMLREIAGADYGWKAEEFYARLKPMPRTGHVGPEDFHLQEVLELIRWSEPDEPDWKPGRQGSRGHWMRLFACTALLRLAPLPACRLYIDSETDTLAQLIASAVALGEPVARASASLLAWRSLADAGDFETPAFLAFGILLLAAYVERSEDRGPWLKQLADWVEAEEARARTGDSGHEWLLGLTPFRMRDSVWRSLARRILIEPVLPHPPQADEALRLLGEMIVPT